MGLALYVKARVAAVAAKAHAHAAELVTPAARPAALYAAAMVHVVLGDCDLAARDVTQYLDGGGTPAKLGYRWFDFSGGHVEIHFAAGS
jgi:hypothetical protein